jgi:hypothetical protein
MNAEKQIIKNIKVKLQQAFTTANKTIAYITDFVKKYVKDISKRHYQKLKTSIQQHNDKARKSHDLKIRNDKQ